MPEPDPPISERQRMSLTALPPQVAHRAHALLGWSHRGRVSLDVLDGALEGDVLRAASAMAFDLFLAAIPLLALAGWMFGHMLRSSSAGRPQAAKWPECQTCISRCDLPFQLFENRPSSCGGM